MIFMQEHSTALCFIVGGLLSVYLVGWYSYERGHQAGEKFMADVNAHAKELARGEGYAEGHSDGYALAKQEDKPIKGAKGYFVRKDGTYTPHRKSDAAQNN